MMTTHGDHQKTMVAISEMQAKGKKGHFCGPFWPVDFKTSQNRKDKATLTLKSF